MSEIEYRGTGVRRARRDGQEYWVGNIQDVTRALVLAATSGRLTDHGEIRPYPPEPGNVIVAVQLAPQPARVTVLPPGPVAIHQPRPRWVWPLVAGIAVLALMAVVAIAVVQLLAAVVPIVLGAVVVGLVAWLILRAGGGRGGDAGGGGFAGIHITQIVNVRRR